MVRLSINMRHRIVVILLLQLRISVMGSSRLGAGPESISFVDPILTDANGQKISDITGKNDGLQTDGLRPKRQANFNDKSADSNEKIYISISHNSEELLLELTQNRKLITPHTLIEWVMEDGSKKVKKLSSNCYYFGKNIKAKKPSLAAVSNCNGLTGYIQTIDQSYFIEPLTNDLRQALRYGPSSKENDPNAKFRNGSNYSESHRSHIIYSVKTALKKLNLSVQKDQEFKKRPIPRRIKRSLRPSNLPIHTNEKSRFLKGGKRMAFLYKGLSLQEKLREKSAKAGIGRHYSKINCKRHGNNARFPAKVVTKDDIVCKEKTQRRIRNAEMREHRKIIKERRRREREKRKVERKRRRLEKAKRKEFRRKKKGKVKLVKLMKTKSRISVHRNESVITMDDPLLRSDWEGYSPDGQWDMEEEHSFPGENVRDQLSNASDSKWLEIAVGIDHTVIDFHGEENVEKYVLTLFNIVSAIYGDSSLQANLQIVLLRLIFYKDKRYSQVKKGMPKRSLEAVNMWANRLYSSSPKMLRHDLAVWLTKYDLGIGGPSGYAPVSGICEPERSCTLNKDEGLTSAFIIAHEIGHVLGLSHDGDIQAENKCESKGFIGFVMAPLVAATHGRFHWSSCSKNEYHRLEKSWHCLSNEPTWEIATVLSSSIKHQYSLDEQCKMEFGEGFGQCRSYGMSDPCIFLWCSNISTASLCKTKKGPPLEGTICGLKKWCHRGFCRPISKVNYNYGESSMESLNEVLPPASGNLILKSGDWSQWSEWGPCSRTCGMGVSFRTRKCNNPELKWGGLPCKGKTEDWKTCSTQKCRIPGDLRREQCQLLKYLVKLPKRKAKLSWLPYESRKEKKKCKLTCVSVSTKEVYIGRDNVLDGTKCSYDNPDAICVKGKCIMVGCDGSITSLKKTDRCGVCGGDNSTCIQSNFLYLRRPPRDYADAFTIPLGASHITIQEETPFYAFLALKNSQSTITLNAHGTQEAETDFVAEGALFHYKIVNGKESITATGPLLNPVTILVHGGKIKEEVILTTNYTTSRENASAKWEVGPYTPCSASCNGGMQQETVVCRNLLSNEAIISASQCKHLEKPYLKSRTCNLFGCEFRWISSPWQQCSATCGSNGVQKRTVSCVQSLDIQNPVDKTDSAKILDPTLCTAPTRPIKERPCNRISCPTNLESNGWSECSVTCGVGHQQRVAKCVGTYTNQVYPDCGLKSRTEMRVCVKKDCPSEDCRDQSKYCNISYFKSYCSIPKYRKMCCLSCNETI